ncbi:MAG TPA: DUF6531 domain-containing protein, partial [Methylomirabilota bacterium]|nr:DUF6531 domain-containing protein [Methylomirabilota bacterium]
AAGGTAWTEAELWDSHAQAGVSLPTAAGGRLRHTAVVLPTGDVLISGGVDASGGAVAVDELFDPETLRVTPPAGSPPDTDLPQPQVTASIPGDSTTGVPVEILIGLRFSRPLRPDTLSAQTVILSGPRGIESAAVVSAEGGRLAFVSPEAALEPGTTYTLALIGPVDELGQALPRTEIRFTTATPAGGGSPGTDPSGPQPDPGGKRPGGPGGKDGKPDSPGKDNEDEDQEEASGSLRGHDRSDQPPMASPGVTALAGRVRTLNGQPLRDVTLRIGTRVARTDRHGWFLLRHLRSGHNELLIDGRTASRARRQYGVFPAGVVLNPGQTLVLPYTIWMPEIDTANAIRIPSPTTDEVVLTTPRIPGLEVRLPAGSVVRDHAWQLAPEVSITPIPLDRPPFPIPADVHPPAYFTLQPGAGYVYGPNGGARIIYPNAWGYPAGAGHSFWHYDPGGQGWYIYGLGHVTADGRQVMPDPGVSVYEFTGAMAGGGPPRKPPEGGDCEYPSDCPKDGDPVSLSTGHFTLTKTDVVLPGPLPITLQRTFVAGETVIRPFGMAATHNYAIFIAANPGFQDGDLNLPDGRRVRLVRTNPGSGATDGIFTHTESPTRWHGLDLRFVSGRWIMTLRDGTVYEFDANWGLLQRIQDRFGNWLQITLGGGQANLSRIEASSGRWLTFTYHPSSNRIHQLQDNLGRTWTYLYDGSGRLQTVTDPEQGVTEYTYNASHRMATLKDARNIVFLTNEYDANGRVFRQTQA